MGKNWRPTIEIAKITKNIGTTRPQTFTYRSWQCPPRSGRRMRHGDEFLAPKRGRVGNGRHVKDAKRRLQRNPTLPRNAPMTVDSRLSQRAARTVVGAAHSLPQNGCERRRTVNSRQTTADFNLALTRPSVPPGRALDARTRAPRAQRRPGGSIERWPAAVRVRHRCVSDPDLASHNPSTRPRKALHQIWWSGVAEKRLFERPGVLIAQCDQSRGRDVKQISGIRA